MTIMAQFCRRQRGPLILVVLVLWTASTGNGQSQDKQRPGQNQNRAAAESSPTTSPQPSPTATINPLAIAVPQIGTEAIQLNQRLRSLPDRIPSEESIAQAEETLNNLKATIAEKFHDTETVIRSGAILNELEELSHEWQALKQEVAELSGTLAQDLTKLDKEISLLKTDESRWSATAGEPKPEDYPPELLALTSKAQEDLNAAVKLANERRGLIVTLQHSVTEQGSIAISETENVKKAINVSQRSLLDVDSPPLWKAQFASQSDENFARLLRRSYASDLRRVKAFVISKRRAFFLVALFTLCALVIFVRLSRQAAPGSESITRRDEIFSRPASLALLVGIFAAMPLFHDAPRGAKGLLYAIGVVPVVRLLRPRLTPLRRQMLTASIVSLLVSQAIVLTQLPLWIKRDLLQIFVVLVMLWFGFIIYKGRRNKSRQTRRIPVVIIAVQFGVVLFVVAFFANLFGYVGLSDLLIQATLVAIYRGITIYAIVVVGSALITFALQPGSRQNFATLRSSSNTLARRLSNTLALFMLVVWIHQTLNLFAVRQDLYEAISRALAYQIKVGSATIAGSSIVAFVLTLILGYVVAAVLRATLGEQILPRLQLARGLPNAIATITHYVLLLLIFILALAAAGVELSKFTVLTGAVGVGLGFGLQNVVNNFVSGLILLFERPVRIGDLLQIGMVSGEVTKIGFRSSTLHVFDGSDLIIPNGDLISQQVVNWTLTGTRRQIVLTIPVGYGNDPTQVRDLLQSVPTSHPDVLEDPAPVALFMGFGDSALNFEIRFWAPRPEIVADLRSDVALRMAAALSEAGIKVPVPRRDLYITSEQVPSEVAESLRR